jgi:hypothetical protein
MTAVASTIGIVNIGECLLWGNVGRVHAIAEQIVRRNIERRAAQNASDGHSLNNVDNVVCGTAAVWESGSVAGNQAQTLAFCQ